MSEQTQSRWSPWRKANYRYFERHLDRLPKEFALIDLGAGNLQFEELFLRFKYTGVDFKGFDHVSVVTDLTKDIPLPAASADIVTLSNTVEHIPNTEHLFAECKRLLKPGGLLVGTIPFMMQVHQAPYDYNRYTSFKLATLLTDAGFRDIEVEPLGALIDAYNTIEQKFFDHAENKKRSFVVRTLRLLRRGEMRILKRIMGDLPATAQFTEGYGFNART